MTEDILAQLSRIAAALERLAPPPAPAESFADAAQYRHDAALARFVPAPDFPLPLDLILGVDRQKARLVANFERFASDLPANHVLLWGARGTGKSSLVKAAFQSLRTAVPSLRLIEVDRDEIAHLPRLFDLLRGHPERFMVLCDDLSFEVSDGSAKALKSALEGGVAGPPANLLFVATSNRRHLMPRDHGDERSALDAAEDADEEVSVSDRFGLSLGFPTIDQATYLAIVRRYAVQFDLPSTNLDRRALQWAQLRGARSGRVAWQFIRDLAGEIGRPV